MPSDDVIVAGRGIAGTLLSWFLIHEGYRVVLYGDEKPAASHVAAGILHPITGRRLVKSWMADTFFPFAEETYKACEAATGKSFYREMEIFELLRDAGEYNAWVTAAQEHPGFVSSPVRHEDSRLKEFPYGASVRGGCLDTKEFLGSMNSWIGSHATIVKERLDPGECKYSENEVTYGNCHARMIVFCEGITSMSNPLWSRLPWQPSKGELLMIRCPGMENDQILNRSVFILPLGNHRYRAGSTYSWDELNDVPTERAKEKLEASLKKILQLPFEITGQEAAVRPTVKERRPFLGFHPVHASAGIFNGLGTKGAMTGPWLAQHLVKHIKYSIDLLPEVNVRRFADILA